MNTLIPIRRRTAIGTVALAAASLLLAPTASAPSPALAAPAPAAGTVSIDLEGAWSFTRGDDPSYADPAFDDSAWQSIQVPGDGSPFDDYDGFAWYRLDFTLPADAEGNNLVASLGFLDDVDEAFLNGVRIGGSGTMPPAASSQWFEKRLYPVPATAPNFGGENTLAVRLYDMNGGGGWYEGPVGIYSKDAVRQNVYGITGPPADAAQISAVMAALDTQRAALAAGDVDAYVATLEEGYFHDGRTKERRERELRAWAAESGGLTLTDSEVEVVQGPDGSLIVDTNRAIMGTRDGEPHVFQPPAQQFLRFSASTLLETGNRSRFFREAVDSQLEGRAREFVTYLPPSYLTEPAREYPVVYLLHGINGGSREWEPREIDTVLDALWADGLAESIVIMPDGESLWYADQPGGTPWRSMFLTEMVPLVDAEYRTLDTPPFRALTGVSMGGFGAFSLGLSHPELFSSLASHIGSLSFSGSSLPTPLAQAQAMSAEQLSQYDLYFDACEFDEYRFDDAARSMSTLLTGKGVAHTWAVYPEGRHNDACWMPHLGDSFTVHSDHFRAAGLVEDTVAPTVALDAAPASPDGTDGWYRTAVALTVTATDDRDDAPLIEAQRDGGAWAPVDGPIRFDGDGAHAVSVRATDTAGNVSEVVSWSGRIDATAPSVQTGLDHQRRVTLTAADETSGVATVEYRVTKKDRTIVDWTPYRAPVRLDGASTLSYRATDAAGNTSEVGTTTRAQLRPAATVTRAATSRLLVSGDTPVTYTVAVSAVGGSTPVGTVAVTDNGRPLATIELTAADDGRAAITLPRLPRGIHLLRAEFTGTGFAPSASLSALLVLR
ncbi:alpha/beta hydrolase-fold protein [Microbacterium sp. zg-Y818]|uniref:OmpL47-type beta-barrel domain-containing protein n=1 Tax=unclassified Microbacterium TaxID=2609290 RepID=UPI00214BC832|nr:MULTISPECIES: alpha/beta hydrolase-fold protein [unclassified Microbacterium]MCR2800070.1 alpha/beta hydrolase-fold protein [Microbacterium sp. zg.Y818]WIM22045.1 alpha/beta hydrolase-fold protein [Microbacterium sp. zg-Y818]